jgi:hypothetical protein
MAIKFGKTQAAKAKAKPAPKPSAAARKTPAPLAGGKPKKRWKTAVERKKKGALAVQPTASVIAQLFDGSEQAVSELRTLDDFMKAGHNFARRSVEAVFYFSALILAAKERLDKDDYVKFTDSMSLASSSASQYMTIARSERLRKLKEAGKELPTTAHVLYLLASMDDDEYKAFTKEHKIDARLDTDDLRDFRTSWKDREKIAHLPKTTRQAAQEAAEEHTDAAVAPVGDNDEGAFQAPPEADQPSGSPNMPEPQNAALVTFRELGEGILAIKVEDMLASIHNVAEAGEALGFATQLVEHVELIRTKFADHEFDLQDAAA